MDNERSQRLLIPPIFLAGAIPLAAALDPALGPRIKVFVKSGRQQNANNWIGVVLGAGVSVVGIGFAIGTITIAALRAICLPKRVWNHCRNGRLGNYEACVPTSRYP